MSTLGTSEIPGDAGAVLAVADRLGTIAENTSEIARQVRSGDLEGSWSGPGADAFRLLVHQLPGDIDKIANAHETARSALVKFGHELQAMKTQAGNLATQLEGARAEANAAAARERAAQKAAVGAQVQHTKTSLDPAAHRVAGQHLAKAKRDLANASSAKDRTHGTVGSLETQAQALKDQYDASSKAAATTINDACTLSLGERWGASTAGQTAAMIGDMLGDAIMAPVNSIKQLLPSLERFIQDPSWTNARGVIDGLGTVVAIVVCVIVIAATFGAATPLAVAFAMGVSVATSAAKFGATAMAVQDEGLDPKELIGDSIGLGLSVIPAGKLGWKVFKGKDAGAKTHYIRYGEKYNPLPKNEVRKKALEGTFGDPAIVNFLVDLEYGAAELLLGAPEEPPTIFTPAAREKASPPLLYTPNATVRHHIALTPEAGMAA